MKQLIQWLRSLAYAPDEQTDFSLMHYAKFEEALSEGDLEVNIYDDVNRGQIVVFKGTELHPVTVGNLVSFRKLTRRERRHYDKHLQKKDEKENYNLHRRAG